mgnify:CR=1 FL=1
MKNWRNIVCVTTIYKRRASTQGEDELKVVHSFRWKQNIFRIIPAPMLLLILADWDSFYSSSGNVLHGYRHVCFQSGHLPVLSSYCLKFFSAICLINIFDLLNNELNDFFYHLVVYQYFESSIIQQFRMHIHHTCRVRFLFNRQISCKFTPIIV